MKTLILLCLSFCLFACTNQKIIEAKAKHQAATGDRINNAQKNTNGLFDELK